MKNRYLETKTPYCRHQNPQIRMQFIRNARLKCTLERLRVTPNLEDGYLSRVFLIHSPQELFFTAVFQIQQWLIGVKRHQIIKKCTDKCHIRCLAIFQMVRRSYSGASFWSFEFNCMRRDLKMDNWLNDNEAQKFSKFPFYLHSLLLVLCEKISSLIKALK